MQVLEQQELNIVNGGISTSTGVKATVALMGMAAASPFVVAVGVLAIGGYVAIHLMHR